MANRRIYSFGGGRAEGTGHMKDLLGGKGAGLAEMSNIGIPVPPGFTITTEVCTEYYRSGKRLPRGLDGEIRTALRKVEALTGKVFGNAHDPLLVSVRAGARVSMPGMMDTVLNLGLNDATVEGLAGRSGNPRFAWESYRRFVAMFGDVVLGPMKPEGKEDLDPFEEILHARKRALGVRHDSELPVEALQELTREFKAEIRRRKGVAFPDDPMEQLLAAVAAVFRSWENDRAIAYRRMKGIPAEWGTAVTVQSMVLGNMGDDSGTGVAFTRNPASRDDEFYGEFLVNAEGEDAVAGVRTPERIVDLSAEVARPLEEVLGRLEGHHRDMQDIEFTIERGKVYVLLTRNGKRTGLAAVRAGVAAADEKPVSREPAVPRLESGTPNVAKDLSTSRDPSTSRTEFSASSTGRSGRDLCGPSPRDSQGSTADAAVRIARIQSRGRLSEMFVAIGGLVAVLVSSRLLDATERVTVVAVIVASLVLRAFARGRLT